MSYPPLMMQGKGFPLVWMPLPAFLCHLILIYFISFMFCSRGFFFSFASGVSVSISSCGCFRSGLVFRVSVRVSAPPSGYVFFVFVCLICVRECFLFCFLHSVFSGSSWFPCVLEMFHPCLCCPGFPSGGCSVRGCAAFRRCAGGAGVCHDGHVGTAAVFHLRLPDVRHANPHHHLRRDQHRNVLLPAVLGGLPLVRAGLLVTP